MNYLTTVDKEGKLCWKKSGQRITTSTEWKDTPDGIVPVNDDEAPGPHASVEAPPGRKSSAWSEDISSSSDSEGAEERADRYVNTDLKAAKGHRKMVHVSPATILNQLLRTSVRKNTWIFVSAFSRPLVRIYSYGGNLFRGGFHRPANRDKVADTSFNLYIGIKQSGSFQHSSFLHGSRISAAGLIKIKDGQLRQLSPLRYL